LADKYLAENMLNRAINKEKRKKNKEKKHASREMLVEKLICINRQFSV
jgi:hypothetical protein